MVSPTSKVAVLRIEESDQGTIGVLLINGTAFCCTLEPDHRDKEPCIPTGTYACERVDSPRFGDTFEIKDVPGRTHILFHGGNTEKHTLGCVLVGQYFGKLRGNRAVLNSGRTFVSFLSAMKYIYSFELEIKEV